jgi:hypothetical protein
MTPAGIQGRKLMKTSVDRIRSLLGLAKSHRRLKNRNRRLMLEGLENRRVLASFAAGNLAVIRANEVDSNAPMSVQFLRQATRQERLVNFRS